jgi:hypothetical protein
VHAHLCKRRHGKGQVKQGKTFGRSNHIVQWETAKQNRGNEKRSDMLCGI